MISEEQHKKYVGDTFKQMNSKFHRCFWPKESCSEKAINAHSIQNAGVLDLLCDNNHVIMPKVNIDLETGPLLKFEKIGRNKATTFNGLCSNHDSQLFLPIDTNPFDAGNKEQLFLLSYRSILRELHTKMKAAVDIHSQYKRGVELGKFNPTAQDQPMVMATVGLLEAHSFYLYKLIYDQIYLNANYDQLKHHVCFVESIIPTIAVSSAFSFIDNMRLHQDRQDAKIASLNIFPHNNGTYIILSYRKDQEPHLLPYLERILQAERSFKLYLVSKLVLMYCENFVLAPEFYENLSDSRQMVIKDFFMENIIGEKTDREDSGLYLFN